MKNIEIELIRDTRFTNGCEHEAKKTVENWVEKITEKLRFLIGIETITYEMRRLNFEGVEPCVSYRQKILIRRINVKYKAKLNDIYKAVNSIKPCYYKKV